MSNLSRHCSWSEPPTKRARHNRPQWVFNVIAWKACEDMALQLEAHDPERFHYQPTNWSKFSDSGMDNIQVCHGCMGQGRAGQGRAGEWK